MLSDIIQRSFQPTGVLRREWFKSDIYTPRIKKKKKEGQIRKSFEQEMKTRHMYYHSSKRQARIVGLNYELCPTEVTMIQTYSLRKVEFL